MNLEEMIKDKNSLKYKVCVLKHTEKPFTGDLLNKKEKGIYRCSVCAKPLFESNSKYESHSGWPSFFQPVDDHAIDYIEDRSHGMLRTEVCCKNCGSHLGHVFDDGPKEKTGKRFCINSVSLEFSPTE